MLLIVIEFFDGDQMSNIKIQRAELDMHNKGVVVLSTADLER